jgi:hypothetical protein
VRAKRKTLTALNLRDDIEDIAREPGIGDGQRAASSIARSSRWIISSRPR